MGSVCGSVWGVCGIVCGECVWGVCGECVHLSAERVRCKRPSLASLFVHSVQLGSSFICADARC